MSQSAAALKLLTGTAQTVGSDDINDALGHLTGAVTPVGAVTPKFIGQEYYDTVAKVFYRATDTTNTDWTVIGDPGLSAAELSYLDGVTAGTVTASKAVVVNSSSGLTGMGSITYNDAANFAFSATTGSQFGTTATQKIGYWGAAPTAQPAVLAGVVTTAPTLTVFGFTTSAQFNNLIAAVNTLIANQKSIGFMATA